MKSTGEYPINSTKLPEAGVAEQLRAKSPDPNGSGLLRFIFPLFFFWANRLYNRMLAEVH